jgi:hypothetical protein
MRGAAGGARRAGGKPAVREASSALRSEQASSTEDQEGRIARLDLLQLWLMQCEYRRVFFDKGLPVETDSAGLVVRA